MFHFEKKMNSGGKKVVSMTISGREGCGQPSFTGGGREGELMTVNLFTDTNYGGFTNNKMNGSK